MPGERGELVYRYTGNTGARSGEYLTTDDENAEPIPARSLYEADLAEMSAAQKKAIETNAASAHAIYKRVEPKAEEAPPARASTKKGEG